jgi:hypothetical protein
MAVWGGRPNKISVGIVNKLLPPTKVLRTLTNMPTKKMVNIL